MLMYLRRCPCALRRDRRSESHVHRRLAVSPHDLAGDGDRCIQIRKIQHQVDQGADLSTPVVWMHTPPRRYSDAMEQQHLVARVVDVGVDFEARELARVL
jgi:hypothetical protein